MVWAHMLFTDGHEKLLLANWKFETSRPFPLFSPEYVALGFINTLDRTIKALSGGLNCII